MVAMPRLLRWIWLLCLTALVSKVMFYLSVEHLGVWSNKAHFLNDRSYSQSTDRSHRKSQGLVGGGYDENVLVMANRSDFLMKPESVWPVSGHLNDRILSQLEVLQVYAKTRNITSRKIIIRVGNFNFNHLHWRDGHEHLVKDSCPITNCLFTSNQSLALSADAVVLSELWGEDVKRLLPKPANQIWVALYLEPPHQRPLNSRALGDLVNWTMSYRPDSTIVTPYAKWVRVSKSDHPQTSEAKYEDCPLNCLHCLPRSCLNCFNMNCRPTNYTSVNCTRCTEEACTKCTIMSCKNCSGAELYANSSNLNNCSQCSKLNCTICLNVSCTGHSDVHSDVRNSSTVNYAKGRTKKVAMFVSSCGDRNGRRRYAWELGKYIDVDIYGDCPHSLSCPRSEKDRCLAMLKIDYKFYLSFENSNCVGYITEKLHRNALRLILMCFYSLHI